MIKNLDASDLGIINRLLAVNLRVSIWTARKKLRPQDLGDAELPPDDLASLGSKKICDPAALKIFNTLKSRAIGVLDHYGLRFLGGWAIPEDKAVEVHQRLDAIEEEFNEAKEEFLLRYHSNVQEWIDRQNEWSGIIEDSVESVEYVRSRIGFQSRFYSVSMPGATGDGADLLGAGFQEEVAGFGSALFDDVAQAATAAWRNSFKGQEKVSHKALSPIRKIHEKLNSFSFVDPAVLPIAEIIKAALNSLPKKGYIEGLPLIQFQGLVSLLRDKEALADLAERRKNGQAAEDILAGFIPDDMAQAEEPGDALLLAAESESETDANQPVAAETLQAQPAVPGAMPVPQVQAPAGRFAQTSLLDYGQTIFPNPASPQAIPAQSAPSTAIPVTAEAETDTALTADQPDTPLSADANIPAIPVMAVETPEQPDEERKDSGARIDFVQSEPVIPVIPCGMGDFLNGFI